jgi:hypothetical protein
MIFHEDEFGVTTANDNAKHWELEFASVFVGIDMSAKVVNRDEWLVI